MYPELAVRELVANALIHQDFTITGAGPTVEIFADRMEITNPGRPLIDPLRFIDEPPRSRNEALASVMRRANICEERGSGIDKVISLVEAFQLPAPDFRVTDRSTIAVLLGPRDFSEMDRGDRIRAMLSARLPLVRLRKAHDEFYAASAAWNQDFKLSDGFPHNPRYVGREIGQNLCEWE